VKKNITILYSLTFAMFPVLSQYKLMRGVIVGPLLMILMGVIAFPTLKKLYIEKNSFILMLYIFVHSLIIILIDPSYLDKFVIINHHIYLAIYYIILIISINVLDRELFYKYYKAIATIIVLILYFQSMTYFITGKAFTNEYIYYIERGNRFSSVFFEPVAFSTYLIPLFIISIERYEIFFSIFLMVAIFLSTSSLGILFCFFIIFFKIFRHIICIKKNRKPTTSLFIILTMIVILFIFTQIFYSDFFSFSKNKILSIDYKTDIRFSKGFIMVYLNPLVTKIFGVGYGNIGSYFGTKGISLPYAVEGFFSAGGSEYVNAISHSFLAYGIFGGILFLIQIFNLFSIINKDYIVMPFIFLLFMIVTAMFYGSMFVFIITIFYLYSDKDKLSKYILSFKN